MLLIPFDRKVDWRHPPLVTLLLILLNSLVFIFVQSGDQGRLLEAGRFYQQSGLAAIEGPLYAEYLSGKGEEPPELEQNDPFPEWLIPLQTDAEFQRRIRDRNLLPGHAEDHAQWLDLRAGFESKLADVIFWEYGLKTAEIDAAELIAHMFLHADYLHLLGNMLFLFAVGFLVEGSIGGLAYLGAYLLGGLGAALFDFIFTPDRLMPGIGASGAISGLMGMYAVLFWTRPVRFFYFLFIYFGFKRLPALILLPLWIGNEFYQMLANPDSNINFIAHLGGLTCGAMIGFAIRHRHSGYALERFETEDRDQSYLHELHQASLLCEDLEFDQARPLLKRLHARNPSDVRVMRQLYRCLSIQPGDEAYHRLSQRILLHSDASPVTDDWVLETYRDYLQRAQPGPRLNRELLHGLIGRFISMGEGVEAERLVRLALKRKPVDRRVLGQLPELGNLLIRQGRAEQGRRYLELAERFMT